MIPQHVFIERFVAKVKSLNMVKQMGDETHPIQYHALVEHEWLVVGINMPKPDWPQEVIVSAHLPGSKWPSKTFTIEEFEAVPNSALQVLAKRIMAKKAEIKALNDQIKKIKQDLIQVTTVDIAAL